MSSILAEFASLSAVEYVSLSAVEYVSLSAVEDLVSIIFPESNNMKTYYVHILRCSDNSLYTGITGNFDQRWIQHIEGHFKECYTYKRRPLTIEYHLGFEDVIQAILFEKRLKGWTRAKKIALINNDFETIQLLSECRNFTYYKYAPLTTKNDLI